MTLYYQLQAKIKGVWIDTALISNDLQEINKLAAEQGYSEYRIIQKQVITGSKKIKGCCGS